METGLAPKAQDAASEIMTLVEAHSREQLTPDMRPWLDRILLGDCADEMRHLPDGCADMILTDPPYLVKYRERGGRRILNDDNDRWLHPVFSQAYRLLKDNSFCVCFYGWNQVDKFLAAWRAVGFKPVGHFVWVKTYSSSVGYSRMWHECAYLLVKGRPEKPVNPPPDVLAWGKYSGNKLHPTQKPVAALSPMLEAYSRKGDVVLDPFGGSGSTAVAARQCGRHFVLFEKEEQHFEAARLRLLAGEPE
jgi:site-specific DNA-methyltransferase (adenine-specific)